MTSTSISAPNHCPLLDKPGRALRQRTGPELLALYKPWFGATPPDGFHAELFSDYTVTEYESPESGLRWYAPRVMAGGSFYHWLGNSFRWYYGGNKWDKKEALAYLQTAGVKSFVEVGCGNCDFIKLAAKAGIEGIGIDLSAEVVARAKAEGLNVFTLDDAQSIASPVETLCLFQTLEHLDAPLAEIRQWVDRFLPRRVMITVPCWDSIMGPSNDPLSWPPHHATAWSGLALETLGKLLGAKSTEIRYEPQTFDDFCCMFTRETADHLGGVPLRISNPSSARLRWITAKWWLGRLMRRPWAMRGHSVMAVMKFDR